METTITRTGAHRPRPISFLKLQESAGWRPIHQRIFSALPNRLGAMRPHPTPAIGRVSELAVTDFERRAWLRHVLAKDEGAHIEAYLAEHFEGEV